MKIEMKRKDEGSIEVLLLLSCLVGVVAFFALSLSITTFLFKTPGSSELITEREALLVKKEEKEALLTSLEEKRKGLESQKREIEKTIPHDSTIYKGKLIETEQELKELNREYSSLKKRKDNLKKEHSFAGATNNKQERWEKEKELQELKRKLKEISIKIEETKRISKDIQLDAYSGEEFIKKKEALNKELEKKRQARRGLEKQKDELKIRTIWAGGSQFKNPLFVECKKDCYVLYPNKEVISVSDFDKKNTLKERSANHDIVVLLVRPDGFETFKKAYEKVRSIPSIEHSYEPVENSENLNCLVGVK